MKKRSNSSQSLDRFGIRNQGPFAPHISQLQSNLCIAINEILFHCDNVKKRHYDVINLMTSYTSLRTTG